ncbi:bile acid:sodium symporter [Erythrobacter arachoides]|uniref:Bile acid:sodium symporter n=1 Tax=Aurantiacibacter arachoides TaxID=1850444 RepID=A0A845A1A4_9SPHN|nr:bile acid:sodium symporter [Aurantiacibacter arachoides]MXO93340.1 bile acid:sodium symporter [Aurantiacibacter arachoides]GGD50151.1 bile acid:sodium symporter [Aurantiacibacter arachoides]
MFSRLSAAIDPLVRLLLLAIVLATVFPVEGRARDVARDVSDAAIFLLFLLNGLRLPRREVLGGLRHARFLLPLVAWVFGAMALAGWGAAQLGAAILPASVALGFVFLGVLPSTVQSATAYSSLAGGNVANSVIAAAVLNILGVFVTAPLVGLLASSGMPAIDIGGLERIGLILLLPFALGQLLQRWAGHLVTERRSLVSWADRIAIAIAVYVAFSGAVVQGLWTLLSLPEWAALLGMVGALLLIGFLGAWWIGGGLRLARPDRISFLFAGAQKSIAMGAPLAAILFPPATAGLVLLPVLLYHLLQLVVSAPLAARLSRGG